jgi:hypothetical protein
MSTTKITGSEYTIEDIFSDKFAFTIPSYQRPYAWTTEEAEELFTDLQASLGSPGTDTDTLNPYFLGSLVLIKGENPQSEVVDGQQRLTTLTILLAVLREFVSSTDLRYELNQYIHQKGKISAKTEDRPRLVIREQDTPLFRDEIQDGINIEKFRQKDVNGRSDSQKNLILNTQLYIRMVEQLPEAERIRLIQFLTIRCFVIVVSSPDITSAYRIFSILNNRGLPLSHTDILKAKILGAISKSHKSKEEKYRKMWEDLEEDLSRDGFANLFGHIRMIYRRAKPQDTVLKEFEEHVKPYTDPVGFMENTLQPLARAYDTIRNAGYQHSDSPDAVNRMFEWLNRIDNSDWIPPALFFLSEKKDEPKELRRFFTALERLAAGMMILRHNVNARIQRYAKLVNEIEQAVSGHREIESLYREDGPLNLTADERKEILTILDGDVYHQTRTRLYILLRLDDALSDPEQPSYNFRVITVEHVLPQNPKEDSDWMKIFPDAEQRERYTNMIGNLALLSRGRNAEASNRDFAVKKAKYFTKKVSPFALTMKVLGEEKWTAEQIEARQKEAIETLTRVWSL